jgi:hypothetical protein
MAKIDEQFELLISRQLDGELSPEEELELNKQLIKSPAARELMEEYERNDHLAKMALRAALSPEEFRPLLQAESARHALERWKRALWGMGSVAAVAAAIAIVFLVPGLLSTRQPADNSASGPVAQASSEDVSVGVMNGQDSSSLNRLERVGPRMPFAPTYVTNRHVQRFVMPVVEGDLKDQDVLPVWQIERRREKIRMASGDL